MQVQSRRADVTFDLIFTIYIKFHLGNKQLKKTYFLPLFGEYHIGPKGIELKRRGVQFFIGQEMGLVLRTKFN